MEVQCVMPVLKKLRHGVVATARSLLRPFSLLLRGHGEPIPPTSGTPIVSNTTADTVDLGTILSGSVTPEPSFELKPPSPERRKEVDYIRIIMKNREARYQRQTSPFRYRDGYESLLTSLHSLERAVASLLEQNDSFADVGRAELTIDSAGHIAVNLDVYELEDWAVEILDTMKGHFAMIVYRYDPRLDAFTFTRKSYRDGLQDSEG